MNLATAFGIAEEDIEAVLRANWSAVADSKGLSFEDMADVIFQGIGSAHHDRIACAALDAGCDMDKQTAAAHGEIRAILVEIGILKA